MNPQIVYTHQVPCINSKAFLKIRQGHYGKGKIETNDYFGTPIDIDFEFHLYDDKGGHLVLRWEGHEQIVTVKYYWLYNLRIFACPMGCKRFTTELYYFNRTEWGCAKCLKLTKERSYLRATRLARDPKKLFKFLNKSKRPIKQSVGIAAFYLMQELFKKALRKKKTHLRGIHL
jgi:hypothetical protein